MTVGSINIEETIKSVQEQLKRDRTVSPAMSMSINLLITVIQLLVSRLLLNSTNSSLSPSSDKLKRKRGKDREKRKTKNPIGGQPGHNGETLEQYEEPDEVIPLEIDRRTLSKDEVFTLEEPEKRQVIDVNLEFIVREYQAEVLVDSQGKRYVATFPEHINKSIQYGPSVKALAVYLLQYQLIPYNRIQELF
ncbi:MAG: IS66 family transposase, partial [Oligoflexia bacterium]|nr:IS66 family transposase [Oligoflexia bacterium]